MKFVIAFGVFLLFGVACGTEVRAQTAPPPSPDGSCPAGWHIVGPDGEPGIANPDTYRPDDGSIANYRCELDQSATSLVCGAHGTATAVGGIAACACEAGYAGAACDVCAIGYTSTGGASPTCASIAYDRGIALRGGESNVPFGGSAVLTAQTVTPPRDGSDGLVAGTWRLDGDPASVGCIAPVSTPASCGTLVTGAQALYVPPAQGTELISAEVNFAPAAGGAAMQMGLKASPFDEIAVNGYLDKDVMPIVYKLLDYMKVRCIGAASLGVAKHGKIVATVGLGRKDGRNSEAIWNAGCSDDTADPYVPTAQEMVFDTPLMIGSISKSMGYAVARKAIKGVLREQDIDVRLINLAAGRVISAIRVDDGSLRIDAWDIDAAGAATRRGTASLAKAKDFSLARISDNRFVVALRTLTDEARATAYSVDAAGALTTLGTTNDSTKIKQVEIVATLDQHVVLGLRRRNDTLLLRTYDLEASGNFALRSSEAGETARSFRLVGLNSSRFVGAVRGAFPDVLKFVVWNVDANGLITRVGENDLGGTYAQTSRFDLAALDAGKIVFASRSGANGAVGIDVLSVPASGVVSSNGTLALGTLPDFRVQKMTATRFALVAREPGGLGKAWQFTTNAQGVPTQTGSALGSVGTYVSFDLANLSSAGFGNGFATAERVPAGALRIRTWSAGATALAKLSLSAGPVAPSDYPWDNGDVESMLLVGYDFPDALLPRRLHDIVAGHVQPPMHFNATDGRSEATCTATQAAGYPFADAKWKSVSLGHLFAHRAGINDEWKSAGNLLPYIGAIRDVQTKEQWNAEQNAVVAAWGASNVGAAREKVGLATTVDPSLPDGFLVPKLSFEEMLVGAASMCMPNVQGTKAYSNIDPLWVTAVAEHLTGKTYAAPIGDPAAVQGTLLEEFVQSELGVTAGVTGKLGIFGRPLAIDANGKDPWTGARPRDWRKDATSYYPLDWDVKRPFCHWISGKCKFQFPHPVYDSLDWNGVDAMVPPHTNSNGYTAPTGSLGVQLVPYLKFLGKYWVGGYDENPKIGEARNGNWTGGANHNGALDGVYAEAIQGTGISCAGSAGVDLIVSVNQRSDRVCINDIETDDAVCEAQQLTYGALDDQMRDGICAVDWSKVSEIPWLND